MIGGQAAWENNDFSPDLGKKPMGRLLRSVHAA